MVEKTWHHVKIGFLFLFIVVVTGTVGYEFFVEDWSFLDAFYMTIITITTTGFREIHPLSAQGKIFTSFLIITGVGAIAYTGGRVVQLLIETQILRRRRMSKKLEALRNHYIVCGFGRVGKRICEELHAAKMPFLVIEKDAEKIERIIERYYLFIHGDATIDEILLQAGLQRAKGLIATLATDAENVFATLSAKNLNPDVFIVARAVLEETESKLLKAGADRVVKTAELGAMRMTNLLLRPAVVDFVDLVAFRKGPELSMEEITVRKNSPLKGIALDETPIRKDLNIIIIAIFRQGAEFIYNPSSSTKIMDGDRLIAIGKPENLVKLEELCVAAGAESMQKEESKS